MTGLYKVNRLMIGDNLEMIKQIPDEVVDSCYGDPPFNRKKIFAVIDKIIRGQINAFSDMWRGGKETYLSVLRSRIIEIHRVLKPGGNLILHCDPTMSHYIKVMIDEIFGINSFRNEIIWNRVYSTGGVKSGNTRLGNNHDVLLVYSKRGNKPVFNEQFYPWDESVLKGKNKDEKGYYFWAPLSFASEQRIRELELKKEIRYKDTAKYPEYKCYVDKSKGIPIGDLWLDILPLTPNSKERVGYPTQKPIELLERVIKTYTNPGDIVLDPYMGSGTSCIAAYRLDRFFIGIDISGSSLQVCKVRLENEVSHTLKYVTKEYTIDKGTYCYKTLNEMKSTSFQDFIVKTLGGTPERKKSNDLGIDGRITESNGHIAIQVKQSEKVGRPVVDEFVTAIQRDRAKAGVICGFSFSSHAISEVERLKTKAIYIELKEIKSILPVTISPNFSLSLVNNKAIVNQTQNSSDIVCYSWWLDNINKAPLLFSFVKDNKKDRSIEVDIYKYIKDNENHKLICVATDQYGENITNEIEIKLDNYKNSEQKVYVYKDEEKKESNILKW